MKEMLIPAQGNHNFSVGVLASYFRLGEMMSKGKYRFFDEHAVYIGGNVKKWFIIKDGLTNSQISAMRLNGSIYSIYSFPEQEGERKFVELVYNLEEVFNKKSYLNSKKRHQRITYPFTWLDKNDFRVDKLSESNIEEVSDLYKTWEQYKKDDPTTYQIMFPSARYKRCYEMALDKAFDFETYLYYLNDKLAACRIISIERDTAYDLAFFSRYWELPSQSIEYFNVWTMRDLQKKKVLDFNCGAIAGFACFKKHYPHKLVTSYAYSKTKQVKRSFFY